MELEIIADKGMKENKYWKDNIRGAFYLSFGSEFEDVNDCKPYTQMNKILLL
ncbi:hypothetical protein [Clostridium sp.]|uniref:hypothetical protein n=1 Tax=Clostridium sp. TaxID=1506 RepID=UPI002FDCF0CA